MGGQVAMSGAVGMWRSGEAYERYIGRWSHRVAADFLRWLGCSGGRWVDVGCGSGALSAAVLAAAAPRSLVGLDPSADFVRHAQGRLGVGRTSFLVADARRLPLRTGAADTCAAGLVLNFVPETGAAVAEMSRVTRPGGTVAAYVWDYAEGMQLIRLFWDAAREHDPGAADLDEAGRFPLCRPGPLAALFAGAGLLDVETAALTVPTRFTSFADYWTPFLAGQGPAPAYVTALPADQRDVLQATLAARVPIGADGAVALSARAWAVRGTVAGEPST